jgi:hypothetical protein
MIAFSTAAGCNPDFTRATVLVTKQAVALMDVDIDLGMHYGAARVRPAAMAPHQCEQKVIVVQAVDLARFYTAFVHAAQNVLPAVTH